MSTSLASRPDSDLRRRICRATNDGAIAHTIYSLALSSRWGARALRRPAEPAQLVLPQFLPQASSRAGFADEVLAMAHDLAVHLAFLNAQQAERACHLLGPATWRVVQRLGGWAALHRLPRQVQINGLPLRVQRALGGLGPRTLPRSCARCPLTLPQADQLLGRWRAQLTGLGEQDASRLVAARLSLGSATLLLDRLAAAVADGALPAERASHALGRMCARCPAVG